MNFLKKGKEKGVRGRVHNWEEEYDPLIQIRITTAAAAAKGRGKWRVFNGSAHTPSFLLASVSFFILF